MKIFVWLFMLPFSTFTVQTLDLREIRTRYYRAAVVKEDALQLNKLMLQVDSSALPVMVCYKGANEMIQAKYTLNPIAKFDKFNRGKELIKKAFARDTFNLEIRFIRYSIQNNLPAFLGYHDEVENDKRYLLDNTKESKDPQLQEIIFNYLSRLAVIKSGELKQLKN